MDNTNAKGRPNTFFIDAYFKQILKPQDIAYIDVEYSARTVGQSGYPLWKKLVLAARFGPEYYTNPLAGIIALTLVLFATDVFKLDTYWQPLGYVLRVFPYLYVVCLAVIAFYLTQIYLLLKGKPAYTVIEELN
jgi:hypothetical protein